MFNEYSSVQEMRKSRWSPHFFFTYFVIPILYHNFLKYWFKKYHLITGEGKTAHFCRMWLEYQLTERNISINSDEYDDKKKLYSISLSNTKRLPYRFIKFKQKNLFGQHNLIEQDKTHSRAPQHKNSAPKRLFYYISIANKMPDFHSYYT